MKKSENALELANESMQFFFNDIKNGVYYYLTVHACIEYDYMPGKYIVLRNLISKVVREHNNTYLIIYLVHLIPYHYCLLCFTKCIINIFI